MTASHHADPLESVEAAERAARVSVKHSRIVLTYVERWPGSTSKRLAELAADWDVSMIASLFGLNMRLDRHEIARRLPELEAAGLVHRKIDPVRSTPTREAYIGDRDGAFWWVGPRPRELKQKELFA